MLFKTINLLQYYLFAPPVSFDYMKFSILKVGFHDFIYTDLYIQYNIKKFLIWHGANGQLEDDPLTNNFFLS